MAVWDHRRHAGCPESTLLPSCPAAPLSLLPVALPLRAPLRHRPGAPAPGLLQPYCCPLAAPAAPLQPAASPSASFFRMALLQSYCCPRPAPAAPPPAARRLTFCELLAHGLEALGLLRLHRAVGVQLQHNVLLLLVVPASGAVRGQQKQQQHVSTWQHRSRKIRPSAARARSCMWYCWAAWAQARSAQDAAARARACESALT